MNKGELLEMIQEHKSAIFLVDNHIKSNPTSTDMPMWTNALHRLRKRLAELEECLHLGEYNE